MKIEHLEEINAEIEQVIEQIRKGYARTTICSTIRSTYMPPTRLFELAKCRIYAKKKFRHLADVLFFDEEGLRYATPPLVAKYRSERIGNSTVADISCGVGIQLISFARNTYRAIGVEIDPFRADLARLNFQALGIDNNEILTGDSLTETISKKIDVDTIFSDPSRLPEEPMRYLETLLPNPLEIYELYRGTTDDMVFELPPQINREKIMLHGEKEYTSLDFMLNRLALYMGSLATCDTSAVSLPSGERITDTDERKMITKSENPQRCLYEVDTTITKADLLENLGGKLGFDGDAISLDNRRTILTSTNEYESPFLCRYFTRGTCLFSATKINRLLKKLDAKKAILRLSIPPNEYWKLRKKIEEDFTGQHILYVFRVNENAVVAERG